MSKISFFYDKNAVCKVSLKALERRNYVIDSYDEDKGIIIASSKKQFLKPSVQVQIKVSHVNTNQSSIDIKSELKNSWFVTKEAKNKEEQKLINTLYKCFDSI